MLIYVNLEFEKYKYENILENSFFCFAFLFFFFKLSLNLRANICISHLLKPFLKIQIQEKKRFYIKKKVLTYSAPTKTLFLMSQLYLSRGLTKVHPEMSNDGACWQNTAKKTSIAFFSISNENTGVDTWPH